MRSEKSRRRWGGWGAASVVNLAAAVGAALAFGVWKRSQSPHVSVGYQDVGGFYERADDVGYIPRADIQMKARAVAGGPAIDDVVYTTGPDHFRIVPEASANPDACVLLFGDSFTFGYGVSDDETYGAQLVKRSGRRVAVHNFGVLGWGPHQFLAGLQSGRFQRAVRCVPTDAVYLMIPNHIWRASGVTSPWDTSGPRYRVSANGRPVRAGTLGDPDPYNWRRWIGLNSVGKADASRLAKALLLEATSELRRFYPGIRVHLISYRVSSWSDEGILAEDMLAFEYELQQSGLMPLPLEAVIPRYRFAQRDYILDPADTHPNARAYRLVAGFILREIRPEPD